MSVDGSTLHNGLIFAIAGLETVTPTTPRTYRLLPALAITVLVGSGAPCPWTFGITESGTITYDAGLGFLAGAGTDTLVVGGHDVTIDARAISHVVHGLEFTMTVRGSSIVRRLTPASYQLLAGSGNVADFHFTVGLDGRVTIPARYAEFSRVNGPLLILLGLEVTIRNDGLSQRLLEPDAGTWLADGESQTFRMIPAPYFGLLGGSGIVGDFSYRVGLDGLISYPADCEPFLTGAGTSTLGVGGYLVLVDARAMDGDLLGLPNANITAQTTDFLVATLMPSGYEPQSSNGVFGSSFRLHRDGSLSVRDLSGGRMSVATVAARRSRRSADQPRARASRSR